MIPDQNQSNRVINKLDVGHNLHTDPNFTRLKKEALQDEISHARVRSSITKNSDVIDQRNKLFQRSLMENPALIKLGNKQDASEKQHPIVRKNSNIILEKKSNDISSFAPEHRPASPLTENFVFQEGSRLASANYKSGTTKEKKKTINFFQPLEQDRNLPKINQDKEKNWNNTYHTRKHLKDNDPYDRNTQNVSKSAQAINKKLDYVESYKELKKLQEWKELYKSSDQRPAEAKVDYNVTKECGSDGLVIYSGCKINGQKDGYGKEFYPQGKMKYEGSYKNDKFNGEGKFWTEEGILKYKGTFVDNQKTGYGSLYYPLGHLQYKGQVTNGVYNGNGTYYFKSGLPMYMGQFIDGRREGYGKEYSQSNIQLYEGEFKNNEYNGKGTYYYANGHRYRVGNFEDGKLNGLGKQFDENGKMNYAGHFQNDDFEGYGVKYNESGNIYFKGMFSKGLRQGEGKCVGPTGQLTYEGNFIDDKFGNTGKLYHPNGVVMYEGDFADGLRHGEGKEFHNNGCWGYIGMFKDNLFDGFGMLYNTDELKSYEGEFSKGMRSGRGIEYHMGEDEIYKGEFQNDMYHGLGVAFNVKGYKEYMGEFIKGKRAMGKILYKNGKIFYHGKLKKQQPHGDDVTQYYNTGRKLYNGPMIAGKKQGFGKSWHPTKGIKFIGSYDDNKACYGAHYNEQGKLIARKCAKEFKIDEDLKMIKLKQDIINTKEKKQKLMKMIQDKNQNLSQAQIDELEKAKNVKQFIQSRDVSPEKFQKLRCAPVCTEDRKRLYWREESPDVQLKRNLQEKTMLESQNLNLNVSQVSEVDNLDLSMTQNKNITENLSAISLPKDPFKASHPPLRKKDKNAQKGFWIKMYNDKGGFEYEGTLLNNEKKGYGTLYYKNMSVQYRGGWKNNLKSGFGIEFYPENVVMNIGTYVEDQVEGDNVIMYSNFISKEDPSKLQYHGGFYNSKKNGYGQAWSSAGHQHMSGRFVDDLLDGPDCEVNHKDNGMKAYRGDMQNGLKHGIGQLFHDTGKLSYEGQFIDDEPHSETGEGKQYDTQGDLIYHGDLDRGKKEGRGKMYHSNGKIAYSGTFMNDQPDTVYYGGNGLLYNPEGLIYFKGGLKNGKKHGFGMFYKGTSDHLSYEGHFVEDIANDPNGIFYYNDDISNVKYIGSVVDGKMDGGFGELYHENGSLMYAGTFDNDKMEAKEGIIYNDAGEVEYQGRIANGDKLVGSLKDIKEENESNLGSIVDTDMIKRQDSIKNKDINDLKRRNSIGEQDPITPKNKKEKMDVLSPTKFQRIDEEQEGKDEHGYDEEE